MVKGRRKQANQGKMDRRAGIPFLVPENIWGSRKAKQDFNRQRKSWAAQQKCPEEGGRHTGQRYLFYNMEWVNVLIDIYLCYALWAPEVPFPLIVSLIGSKDSWALSNIMFAYNVFSTA